MKINGRCTRQAVMIIILCDVRVYSDVSRIHNNNIIVGVIFFFLGEEVGLFVCPTLK